jgi:hypothetical protein
MQPRKDCKPNFLLFLGLTSIHSTIQSRQDITTLGFLIIQSIFSQSNSTEEHTSHNMSDEDNSNENQGSSKDKVGRSVKQIAKQEQNAGESLTKDHSQGRTGAIKHTPTHNGLYVRLP